MSEQGGAESSNAADSNHDKHEHLYHLVYVFGLSLFAAIVDFAFLWPENHLSALLALAAAISLITVYEMAVRSTATMWIVITVIGLFAGAGVTYWIVGPIAIPEREINGILFPEQLPTPPNACSEMTPPPPANALTFLIGDSAFVRTMPGKAILLSIGLCNVLSMERKETSVSIDVDLYDAQGRLIAKIVDGQIHAIEGAHTHIERSGNLSELSIFNGAKQELFYAHYLNPATIRVRGVFGCPNHQPIAVNDDEQIPGVALHHSCDMDWSKLAPVPLPAIEIE